MGHEIHRTVDYCWSQREANQLGQMNYEERRSEDSLSLSPPLSGDVQRGYLVWTCRLHACAVGSGPRWASRAHQIIGRAPPCEALCQGDGMQRKTHNFSRWFVWWTNSMRTETGRGRKNREHPENVRVQQQSQREEEQTCVCVFVCVYAHLDWHTIRQQWRDLMLTDSRFVHYHTTLVSISISKQSQVSENQKAVEQQCREEKIKYVTVITKHHILGFWWHNKQAHWGKEWVDTATTAKRISLQTFSCFISQFGSEETS